MCYSAEIICEENASKIVKISQQMAKLCQKLVASFFFDTVYIIHLLHLPETPTNVKPCTQRLVRLIHNKKYPVRIRRAF